MAAAVKNGGYKDAGIREVDLVSKPSKEAVPSPLCWGLVYFLVAEYWLPNVLYEKL